MRFRWRDKIIRIEIQGPWLYQRNWRTGEERPLSVLEVLALVFFFGAIICFIIWLIQLQIMNPNSEIGFRDVEEIKQIILMPTFLMSWIFGMAILIILYIGKKASSK